MKTGSGSLLPVRSIQPGSNLVLAGIPCCWSRRHLRSRPKGWPNGFAHRACHFIVINLPRTVQPAADPAVRRLAHSRRAAAALDWRYFHGWIVLDKPRGSARPRRWRRSSATCAHRRLCEGPRSATAARSIRWPKACCRSRWARRPSSPGGCSKRARPTSSRSSSVKRPTRSMPRRGGRALSDRRPPLAAVAAILEHFTGEIEQVPPAYSALKVDGQRAYDRARAGEAWSWRCAP
jgi:hypothetical protein